MYKLLVLIVCVTVVAAEKCNNSLQCYEKEIVGYFDRLESARSVPILGDVLVLEKSGNVVETARSEEDFVERSVRYLAEHELTVRIPQDTARSLYEEARTRKLKRIILPLLILLKLKAAIVIPAVLAVIALVSFKGLGASLIALAIAGATGLKSLLESHHHHGHPVTYEVVPQLASPHWSRTGMEPLLQGYHTVP